MTELERMLKDTLTRMEQDIHSTLENHSKALDEHQRLLMAHSTALNRQQETISRITGEQQVSAQHLQRLSDIHRNLEPLLSRLNAMLSGK